MSFPRYPAYRDSGAKWLGVIPEHWALSRVGACFDERREKVSDRDYEPLSVTKDGVVPQLETAAKTDDGDNRKKVLVGDFAINSRSDRKGSAGIALRNGSVSLICTVLTPRASMFGGFIHFLMRSVPFQEEYYRFGKGIVADLWSTNFGEMRGIVLPLPSLSEQRQIAHFLDRETAKIDALISEQDRLIELLKDKRLAVISRAVTEGLNPHATMKPSGLDWLGDVPAHWEVLKLSSLMREPLKNGISPEISAAGSTPTFSIAAVRDGRVDIQNHLKYAAIDTAVATPFLVREGDIMVLRGSGSKNLVGTAGIVSGKPPEYCIYPDILIRVRPNSLVLSEYFVASLNSSAIRPQVETSALTAAGIWKISGGSLRELRLPVPPLDEQQKIVEYLRTNLQSLDALSGEAQRAIDLLVERRAALISAAVTGQIDVRGLAERAAA